MTFDISKKVLTDIMTFQEVNDQFSATLQQENTFSIDYRSEHLPCYRYMKLIQEIQCPLFTIFVQCPVHQHLSGLKSSLILSMKVIRNLRKSSFSSLDQSLCIFLFIGILPSI